MMISVKMILAGVALIGTGFGVVSLPDSETQDSFAYEEEALRSLTKAEYLSHASAVFARIDLSQDQSLDADEYATFRRVQAELMHLNGYMWIEGEDMAGRIEVFKSFGNPTTAFQGLGKSEHIRIDGVARSVFYTAAGKDGKLSESEFMELATSQFEEADRNRNQKLKGRELQNLALEEASIIRPSV